MSHNFFLREKSFPIFDIKLKKLNMSHHYLFISHFFIREFREIECLLHSFELFTNCTCLYRIDYKQGRISPPCWETRIYRVADMYIFHVLCAINGLNLNMFEAFIPIIYNYKYIKKEIKKKERKEREKEKKKDGKNDEVMLEWKVDKNLEAGSF